MNVLGGRPWAPIPLVLVALVGGLPASGALLGINWYRLGYSDRGRRLFLLFATLTLAGGLLIGWLHAQGRVGGGAPDAPGPGGEILMTWYLVQVGISFAVAFRQRAFYEQFLMESTDAPPFAATIVDTVVAMTAAAIGGIVVHQAVIRVAVRMFSGS